MGQCFSKFFGGMCLGTPSQCQDCNQVVDCSRGNSLVKQTMGNLSSLIGNGEQWFQVSVATISVQAIPYSLSFFKRSLNYDSSFIWILVGK